MTRSPTDDRIEAAGPARPPREEFFIHPDILLGFAAYRTVDRGTEPRPPDAPEAPSTGRR